MKTQNNQHTESHQPSPLIMGAAAKLADEIAMTRRTIRRLKDEDHITTEAEKNLERMNRDFAYLVQQGRPRAPLIKFGPNIRPRYG